MKVSRRAPAAPQPAAAPAGAAPLPPSRPSAPADGYAEGNPAARTLPASPAPQRPAASHYREPAFEAALDAATGARARSGNRVELLFDGVHSFPQRDALVDSAKASICLQTFIFNSDETGWALAHKLADKARAGVQVRVLYDAVGSNRADPALFEHMKAAGVEVRPYAPAWQLWDLNDRWHEKHLVVDGRASIEGGMNIANEYAFGGSARAVLSRGKTAEKPWRDVDVKLEGPAVGDAARAFLRNWDRVGTPVSAADREALLPPLSARNGGARVRLVQADPEADSAGRTTALYVEAIRHARSRIRLENAYFIPSPPVRAALLDAVRRGVDVRILTNSRTSTDVGFVSDAARYFYDDLVKAGARLYETEGGTLHSKTATFDGEFSIVGSVNLNGRSAYQDTEVAVAVDGESTARALEERFEQGRAQSHRITAEELAHEDLLTNLRQWSASAFAWML